MKIAFVVRQATQFDVPFYRFVCANDKKNTLHVFYQDYPSDWRADCETGLYQYWALDHSTYAHTVLSGCADYDFRLLRDPSFDLVIFNGYKGLFGTLSRKLAASGTPTALRLDTVALRLSPFRLALRRRLLTPVYRSFDRLLATGTLTVAYLRLMGVPPDRIGWFPYGVDSDWFRKYESRCDGSLTASTGNLLVVSKLIARENVAEAMEAFALLDDPDLTLTIVGDGNERARLEKRAARLNGKTIRFTGQIGYHELPGYYHASDVFIHPAKYEPWGVSVQEAISCGCAVVCSDQVGAAAEFVTPGKNGFVYRSGQAHELADGILKALRIPAPVKEQANGEILTKWTYARMWKELLRVAASIYSSPNQLSSSPPG